MMQAIYIIIIISEAVEKDSNIACQENQVEMNVTELSIPTLYCGK